MKPSLWRTSPCDLRARSRKALWDHSQECKEIDTFISQTWGTPGWQKYIVLLMHFYWVPAMVVGGATFVGLTALDVLGIAPSFEIGHQTHASWDGNPKVSPCMLLVPLVVIVSLFLGPCLHRRKTLVFFDAVCINQYVQELKCEGIGSLGGFVAHSKELLILWSPLYLSRAWCVYELAMFVSFRSGGVITVCPVFQQLSVFFSALVVTACCAFWEAMYFLNLPTSVAASLVYGTLMLLAPVLLWTHVTRPYFAQRQELDQQLADFEVAKAECREAADKEFVITSVEHHLGSQENFNEYVRTELKDVADALIPGIGLSWLDLLKMCFPIVCHQVARAVGYWRAGMPTFVLCGLCASMLGNSLFGFPVAIRLHMTLVSRFSRRRASRIVNVVTTLLLGLDLLALIMAFIAASQFSGKFGVVGRFAFLSLAGLLAVVVFAKDACQIRSSASRPQPKEASP